MSKKPLEFYFGDGSDIKDELENEAKALEIVLRKERAEAKRNELGEQIRAAEAAGDEEKMLQLMAEMNKIIRKS